MFRAYTREESVTVMPRVPTAEILRSPLHQVVLLVQVSALLACLYPS